MSTPLSSRDFDEGDAFLCACKGEPYTVEEWAAEVHRLDDALNDASRRWQIAEKHGVCLPARFDQEADHAV